MKLTKLTLYAAIFSSLTLLTACDDNDNDLPEITPPPVPAPVNYSYQVSVKNLTNGQPVSPVAVVLHNEGNLWQLGEMASVELETMAESGDASGLTGLSVVLASNSGAGVIMPGMGEDIAVTLTDTMPMMISVATMLVNTNDAFTGINGLDISSLAVDESISLLTSSYDAGTEKNNEMSGTIPGPADGGEGFNATRDDVDFVAMHPGVVSQDDGLSTSVLTEAHKFDNPTLAITITRTE